MRFKLLLTDNDECLDGNHSCALIGGNCTNTVGSFTCACLSGYTGDGHICAG